MGIPPSGDSSFRSWWLVLTDVRDCLRVCIYFVDNYVCNVMYNLGTGEEEWNGWSKGTLYYVD